MKCSPLTIARSQQKTLEAVAMRLPRRFTVFAGAVVHKVWRGHNKEWNLGEESEKRSYLGYLAEELFSERYPLSCEIHALTLMSNHAHEIYRIIIGKLFSSFMRRHHARFGMYFNRKHSRSGKVAEDRPKTYLIEGDRAQMRATFYVHANPLRAKMVKDVNTLNRYRYSTQMLYALGKREAWMDIITLPRWYLAGGKTPQERQRKYRRQFARYLRKEGLEHNPFLRRAFYGPVGWMASQQKLVSAWRKENALSVSKGEERTALPP